MNLTKFDIMWIFMIIGTAIGAGVLFLPLKLNGLNLVFIILFYMLMLFLNTRTHIIFTLLVLKGNFFELFEQVFNGKFSRLMLFLYIIPILVTTIFLSMSFVNAVYYILMKYFDRSSIIIPTLLLMVIIGSLKLRIIKILNKYLVFLLCLCILILSIILFYYSYSYDFIYFGKIDSLFSSIPVGIHSFNYLPLLHIFAKDILNHYKDVDIAKKKIKLITTISNILLMVLIFIFSLSCIMAINEEESNVIKTLNVPIVSYIASKYDNFFISFMVPIVSIIAILTSFFSYYNSSVDSLCQFFTKDSKNTKIYFHVFIFVGLCLFSWSNTGILNFMSKISGPMIIIVFILIPMFFIYKNNNFNTLRNKPKDFVILATTCYALVCSILA